MIALSDKIVGADMTRILSTGTIKKYDAYPYICTVDSRLRAGGCSCAGILNGLKDLLIWSLGMRLDRKRIGYN